MAKQHTDIWTYLLITIVAALIWYGAAGETRTTDDDRITVRFNVTPEGWLVEPSVLDVSVNIEGSASAVREAKALFERVEVTLPDEAGARTVDLARELERTPLFADAAVTLLSVTPAETSVEVVEVVSETVPVIRTISGVTTQDEVEIDPAEVTVSMPRSLRRNYPEKLEVAPQITDREIRGLEPGRRHTFENVRLALVRGGDADGVTISPPRARVSLTVRSLLSELALERPVRIQLLASPEDGGTVTFDPVQLRDVTVRASVEIIEQIRRGEASVWAVLALRSREREAEIKQKRVSHFLVELADGSSQTIEAWVGDGKERRPEIALAITLPPAGE